MVEENKKELEESVELYIKMMKDPFLFIKTMWWLVPQKEEEPFLKWKHISWQQAEMIQAVKDAVNGVKSRKISVRSWRGIGKTAFLSRITLWFVYCYKNSIITCTWPSAKQLQDGIWKELSVWLNKMPDSIKCLFEKTNEYLRVIEKPAEWYARLVTGTKENAENVSGVHADNVMALIDEASWVEDEIMDSVKGMMTSKNAILIMIGNPKRLEWYFYHSHNKLRDNFQTFAFSWLDSPNVDRKYVDEQLQEYGSDSDEYRFNVLGEFPKQDGTDNGWWLPLIKEENLHFTTDSDFNPTMLGIDPSGQWEDESLFVGRDNFKAKILACEGKSNEKTVAGIWLTLQTNYWIYEWNITVDNFGAGANVAQEMALARVRVNGVNVWEKAYEKDRFINLRAEAYWKLREWLISWGELVNNPKWKQLLKIKYKRQLDWRIAIMSKKDMKKLYWDSPDAADALMLTFINWEELGDYEDSSFDVDYSSQL